MTADLRQIVEGVLLVFAALFPIVNPLGGAPIFLAMTTDYSPDERASLAWKVTVNAFILLVASVATGTYVLELFGLSVPVVQVAGGVVVSTLGWRLLQDPSAIDDKSSTASASRRRNLAFYPLTMPLTVGPGSISVAITIGAPDRRDSRIRERVCRLSLRGAAEPCDRRNRDDRSVAVERVHPSVHRRADRLERRERVVADAVVVASR